MFGLEDLETLNDPPGRDRAQAEDVCVFVVVRVVARAQSDLLESVFLVKGERRRV